MTQTTPACRQGRDNRAPLLTNLPLILGLATILLGGIFLLDRADAQARDTTRKHHLQDIEQALYLARQLHGTYPPYDAPRWCGSLNDPANAAVREQVEAVLRQKNDQYSNQAKPFPTDPRRSDDEAEWDYFYWKRSPAIFELYGQLETDPNGDRTSRLCPGAGNREYDYGLNSPLRENTVNISL